MNPQILPLTRADIDPVALLEEQVGDTQWSRKQFERELDLPFSRFFVLFAKKQVGGYGGFWKIADEAQITNLAIRPELRQQGLGKQLLFHLLNEARREGCTRVTLEVRIGNEAALGLYRNLGFVTTTRRPQAYSSPPEDALLMEKEL